MGISFVVAIYFQFLHTALGFQAWDPSLQLVCGVVVTSIGWLSVTLMTPPVDRDTLRKFCHRIRPLGSGWRGAGIEDDWNDGTENLTAAFLSWFLACIAVYATLFATGYALYGRSGVASACFVVAILAVAGLLKTFNRVSIRST